MSGRVNEDTTRSGTGVTGRAIVAAMRGSAVSRWLREAFGLGGRVFRFVWVHLAGGWQRAVVEQAVADG